ncbi:MAG: VOC family protein [Halobacteriales archaeon]|nr:VOC family protein [Halobacteriales archaeon]
MPAGEVRLGHAAPVLSTRDLAVTKAWYERHLGFRAFPGWEKWEYLILERDGVRLHFRRGEGGHAAGGEFYLQLSGDIDGLAARMKQQGADLHDLPEDQPYGMREFVVHDADGRHVRIGKPLGGS